LSVRLKLTLSYAGFLMVAGALLLAVVWVFLLRYVPDAVDRALPLGREVLITGPSRTDLLKAFVPKAALALGALLIFGLVGGWILAGQMLTPLARITNATRVAAGGSLGHRIRLEGRKDEFRELADSFDAMLARLEAQVAEQQRFAANASHELRTPLAVTQTLLDVARKDPAPHDRELIERLHVVNSRAIDLTEALLTLSRAARGIGAREPVDLSLIVEEAVETLLPFAEQRRIAIETSGGAAVTIGSQTLLLQLCTNLVHNAVVHNVPEGGIVWIATDAGPRHAELTVENTGGTIAPQLASTLTEPFVRAGGRLRSEHSGVGLGLAIVQRITEAHDGHLVVSPRVGGGLRVTVRLPLAPPPAGT
jgi:two-component system sensor histidine kinase VanS